MSKETERRWEELGAASCRAGLRVTESPIQERGGLGDAWRKGWIEEWRSERKGGKAMRFELAIGDWSGDGHGEAEHYEIEADVDLDEVRRLYLVARDAAELHPENVCEEYAERLITNEQLNGLGVDLDDLAVDGDGVGFIDDDGTALLRPIGMARLWVAWMNRWTSARFELIENDLPALHWAGSRSILSEDSQDHIGFFGYGTLG